MYFLYIKFCYYKNILYFCAGRTPIHEHFVINVQKYYNLTGLQIKVYGKKEIFL